MRRRVLISWIAVNNDPFERDRTGNAFRLVEGSPVPGPTLTLLFDADSPYVMPSVATGADGSYNLGRYSNQRMDYIVDRVKTETDLPVRNRLLTEGLQLSNDTVSHIPLHNQIIPWAMRRNVTVVHRADNVLQVAWVSLK